MGSKKKAKFKDDEPKSSFYFLSDGVFTYNKPIAIYPSLKLAKQAASLGSFIYRADFDFLGIFSTEVKSGL
jgi:hypothetical protein